MYQLFITLASCFARVTALLALGEQILWNDEPGKLGIWALIVATTLIAGESFRVRGNERGTPRWYRTGVCCLLVYALISSRVGFDPIYLQSLFCVALMVGVGIRLLTLPRVDGSSISSRPIFTLCITTLLIAAQLADYHLGQYAALIREPHELNQHASGLVLIVLALLLSGAWRSFVGNAAQLVTKGVILSALLFCTALTFAGVIDQISIVTIWELLGVSEATNVYLALVGILLLPERSLALARRASTAVLATVFAAGMILVGSVLLAERRSECVWPATVSDEAAPEVDAQLVLYLLAAEDPIFMRHSGVDYQRLRQAVSDAVKSRKFGRGGSTITMQLAKVCYLDPEKSLWRKAQQILLAHLIELKLTKAEILAAYLESVPFAVGVRGISVATRHFYNVSPAEMNKAQSLAIVQTIFDPAAYNPSVIPADSTTLARGAVIRGLSRRYCVALKRDLSSLKFIQWSPEVCD